ncbi:MAG: flavodoxin-dependent (E)-4-hydroxy-3-methylbut-2-enyl-diphosphate synthase [Actinobacteria bacterium]|nr:flavodoxin-dependent (E)-4-hydroxy-3-methylbut-2-enyl-diphosphate synthase [Actinomycetota bacterium]MBU1944450.1 flavodoxin-dependent (E)-4-hydroxy-3-methylbut-2-enyl-diphosphate synthase [Actinomycetota bacterium]MBU2687342.1 flavodoxin-dependent (E)-4-hydroxy-3-methylbut-2-enyl-diphosphate synthase [Actinomycetota bacterium]
MRRISKKIRVGDVAVGGDAPVTVQSMTNTDTSDVEATLAQIRELEAAGCDLVRVAVPDDRSADALPRIMEGTRLPVIADLHFDWRLAFYVMEQGVPGIRINPGTLGKRERVGEIAAEAARRGIAVRIGVNSGSLERRFLEKGERAEAEALAASALDGAELVASRGVENIKLSVKASDVPRTIEAYRFTAARCDWPLHVGVTEAGTLWSGTIKSAVGIGALLSEGIGDTIRVSLTASPVEEVRVGRKILDSLGLRESGPEVVSCPTCARTDYDVIAMAERVERELESLSIPIRVAVMGCTVNGPGEAREADIGLAGGRDGGLLFVKGEMVRKVPSESMLEELLKEIRKMASRIEEA